MHSACLAHHKVLNLITQIILWQKHKMYCPLIHPHIDYLENYLKSNLFSKIFANFISFMTLMCNNISIVLSAGICVNLFHYVDSWRYFAHRFVHKIIVSIHIKSTIFVTSSLYTYWCYGNKFHRLASSTSLVSCYASPSIAFCYNTLQSSRHSIHVTVESDTLARGALEWLIYVRVGWRVTQSKKEKR
jgi:hypothetical protein